MAWSLNDGVTVAETPDGVVLLDEREGRYWQLNDTGGVVLRSLLEGGGAERAVAELRRRYPSAGDVVAADVQKVVGRLKASGMVRDES
ncbi:lasso peptide biosynthesis PqqD family chaperone [Nocardiopsis potens]|uniref:lasso peptide biosynthesis PqqD family chaperone n=1 Tax=Nocardiopsis potens TaxID=1246458 RepID=UPI00059290F5|nr:lasso peptide biosynthesis PqqD family chaperone [Nocardiopsis potens]